MSTDADVQADSEAVKAMLLEIAEGAGCTDQCKLLGAYSIREIANIFWHGTPAHRAEVHVDSVAEKSGGRDKTVRKLTEWVKGLHLLEQALAD